MRAHRSSFALLGTLAVSGLSVPAGAQPVGSEFQINTYATGSQDTRGSLRSVAADASGNFIVVWWGSGEGQYIGGIFGRRYDSEGTALGAEFPVNTTNVQSAYPSVAAAAGGNFVVVWQGQDGSGAGIFGQRFDGAGEAEGAEFQVNTFTTHNQGIPDVAFDASGNFVVVWRSAYQDGSSPGVFGQRYDSAGVPRGSEFRINSHTPGVQTNPAVASDADGNFVVVWQSIQDGSGNGVFGQRFDSAGHPQGAEFRVNSYTTNAQEYPFVASDTAGNFVVVWDSAGQDGSSFGIFGQRFDSAGVAQGGEFRVNSETTFAQTEPSVAADASGNFLVVWQSGDGSNLGVFGQLYDSGGAAQGAEFQVNTYTTYFQQEASVAATAMDQFVAVWESGDILAGTGQDGSGFGVFGQRCDFSGGASTIHVGDLDRKAKNVDAEWRAQVKTLVHEGNHVAESGVLVTLNVSGGVGTRTCTTVASGVCEVSVVVRDAVPSLTFTVTSISKAGFSYDAGANHDPDPDSDGTTIVVNQP